MCLWNPCVQWDCCCFDLLHWTVFSQTLIILCLLSCPPFPRLSEHAYDFLEYPEVTRGLGGLKILLKSKNNPGTLFHRGSIVSFELTYVLFFFLRASPGCEEPPDNR